MTTPSKAPVRLTRRGFLGALWSISLVGLFAQAGAALFEFLKPRVASGAFGAKVNAGKAVEFTPGKVLYVREGRFYISRLEDGGILALWQRCTHLGCSVPWRKDEGQFHCPCHSSLFNARGEVIGGPAPRPLDLFPIEVVDGDLVVDTGHPLARDRYEPSQALRL